MKCDELTGRLRQICEGTSGLPPEVEEAYRRQWAGLPSPNACVYRGEHIGEVECPSCTKKVKLKLFACQLFSQCVMTEAIGNVRGCADCNSRLEKLPE